ncbi:MAG: nucleotidyltransferase family protein [Spirochaetota bacterium]|jgi:predicted nucleotidyltransferase
MDKNLIKESITEILRKQDVKKAGLFGSIVRGDFSPDSDVDILIEFNDKYNKSLLDLIELKSLLEEKTKLRIDLLTYDSINPRIRESILQHHEPLYG